MSLKVQGWCKHFLGPCVGRIYFLRWYIGRSCKFLVHIQLNSNMLVDYVTPGTLAFGKEGDHRWLGSEV